MITFILNNETVNTQVNPSEVLLDFIRSNKYLTGTKEVCKEGDCGACSVLIGEVSDNVISYKPINSCLLPLKKVEGKHVVTVEGLNQSDLSPIQKLFVDENASQCGFCTPGFIISITGYLLNTSLFNTEDAINSIAGNICRCTGYHSIIRAVDKLSELYPKINSDILISEGFLPGYFSSIFERLSQLNSEILDTKNFNNNVIVAGGTDLFVQKADKLLFDELELTENLIPQKIYIEKNRLFISGSTTVSQFKSFLDNNNTGLNLDKLFKYFASILIRNGATIAGNIVNASPIADITICLLTLNTELILNNFNGKQRRIGLQDFYTGYKEYDKESDELIEYIILDLPDKNTFFNFEKVSKRKFLDIASVNSAINIKIDKNKIVSVSISAGGVAPIPLLLKNTSKSIYQKEISNKTVDKIIKSALSEISPISDVRGSAEYKSLLLKQLISAHFLELFPQLVTHEVFDE